MKSLYMVVALLLYGCATVPGEVVTERIFRGEPEFSKLEPSIKNSKLINECPEAAFGQIRFVYKEEGKEKPIGKESYVLVNTEHGLSSLEVTAISSNPEGLFGMRGWPSSSGTILTCGGVFNFAYREQLEQQGVTLTGSALNLTGLTQPTRVNIKQPNRRYEVIDITESSGGLFPLKAGNELVISFISLLQNSPNRKGYADHKLYEQYHFKVTDIYADFEVNGNVIPGKVYLVEKNAVGDADTRIDYYFSEFIGWPVKVVDHKDGKPVRTKELSSWNKKDLY